MTHATSRHVILRDSEFQELLGTGSQEFGGWILAIQESTDLLDQSGGLARLGETAHELETFLDDHGARQNRTFVTIGELVASLRGLAGVKFNGLHLLHRLDRYQTLSDGQELSADLRSAHALLSRVLVGLGRRLLEEAQHLGLGWTPARARPDEFVDQRRLLSRNLDVCETTDEREHIAAIGSRLLSVIQASRSLGLTDGIPAGELERFVASRASEDRCRWYESAVHNVQSMYDTHVRGTSAESEHPWLLTVRGHISVAFHLLEMATGLVHFFERHEKEVRHEAVREAMASIVSKEEVLDLIVNTCLRHAARYVEDVSVLAERIIETFVPRQTLELSLPEGVTLHARPLALMVQIARHYASPVEITIEDETCSALSLMGLIMMAGKHPGVRALRFHGDARALEDMELLFSSGLGETGEGLPEQLGYLRVE